MQINIILSSEVETLEFGAKLATACPQKCIIFLQGDLGAGKTTLVRGLLRGLGFTGLVKSPTYTLVECYEIENHIIFHFDLYRLTDPEELTYIGLRDYLSQAAIFLIEWPEQGKNQLPSPDLTCYIRHLDTGRQLLISADSECGFKVLQKLSK